MQRSQASLSALSEKFGINPKTVAKWRKPPTVEDQKTGPKEPRLTVLSETGEAILVTFRHHQNGAKWRVLPSKFGPWWIAAQLFIRWSKLGVWQRLFEKVRGADPALGMVGLS
ncbi:transposase [Komagataeibacter nataicola NRIC 0616]|nr:transposase [Komagataeibacter nataicola NRIC 0616]